MIANQKTVIGQNNGPQRPGWNEAKGYDVFLTDCMFHNFRSYGRRVAFVPLLMAGTLLAGCSSDEGAVGFGFGDDEAVQQNDLRSTIPYEVELTGIGPKKNN